MADVETIFKKLGEENTKTLDALKRELTRIRAGKATTSLVDGIRVEAYGNQSPLNQVSSVSVPDPRTIVINPWDKSIIGEIEKAINQSDLGLNPQNDGKIIRLNVPALTEERRKELVKIVNKEGEESKVSFRQHRKDANEAIKALEKSKDLSEDDSKRQLEQVQKLTDEAVKQVDELVDKKTKEIMTI